jgi:hypothetical protein
MLLNEVLVNEALGSHSLLAKQALQLRHRSHGESIPTSKKQTDPALMLTNLMILHYIIQASKNIYLETTLATQWIP